MTCVGEAGGNKGRKGKALTEGEIIVASRRLIVRFAAVRMQRQQEGMKEGKLFRLMGPFFLFFTPAR